VNKVLVAGASGLVGQAALRSFAALPGWECVGVSRRTPGIAGAQSLSLDLLDGNACEDALQEVGSGVTHLVFAAAFERPGLIDGWFDAESIERNAAMLRNLFLPLEQVATGLQHVSLLQGTKAYGIHAPELGTVGLHVPLRERDPRRIHPNFYFVQEDFLRARQARADWGLTILRPTVVFGDAPGANMNPLLAIGVYAALERELGRPLDFPGGTYSVSVAQEAVDCALVGDALTWAATAPTARGRTFNLTNGDTFNWPSVWPAIAASFGMEVGSHRPVSLASDLPERGDEWARIRTKYGLTGPPAIEELVGRNSLIYADWILNPGRSAPGILNSTIAIRQAGYTGCMDTEDMFRSWFARLQDGSVLPPAPVIE
jgi:nucleoside-diphosphate-sugar epimerase